MSQTLDPEQPSTAATAVPGNHDGEAPTLVRYGVLAFLALMTFVLYLDRQCIGMAAPLIMDELKLSNWDWSIVVNAFALSYALFEIPAGRWGDRYGSRGVLTRIVIWWSIFTALTGAAGGFVILVGIRFLFGAGEAGALPNTARVLREWFPDSSRGRAQGLVTAAMLLGGAAAPIASGWLIGQIGWRWTFVVFANCGVVWAVAFYLWFRDDPARHRFTNAAERRLIRGTAKPDGDRLRAHGPIPWKDVFVSRNIWLLSALIAMSSGIYELFSQWYPMYLQSARGAPAAVSGSLSSLVLGAGAVATIFGGWFSDWLVRRTGNHRWGRTAQAVAGYAIAAAGIVASVRIDSTQAASYCVMVTAFGVQLALPCWWSCATKISGRHVGALFGLMNMSGSVGRIVANAWVGALTDWRAKQGFTGRAQWDPAFYGFAAAALVGMVLWCLVDPREVVEEEGQEKPGSLEQELA
jgi:MFS transporter, ACS family, glucarate transporter